MESDVTSSSSSPVVSVNIAETSWMEKWSEVQDVVDSIVQTGLVGTYWLFSNKVLQVSCTIIITVLVLVLLSLVFWRYRVYYYNQFLGFQKSVHQWSTFESSSNPKYCSVCRQLISGFWIYRNTGWECNICSRAAHLNCLSECEKLECKTPAQQSPLKHKFLHGNLSSDSVCCVCGTLCSSNFGLSGVRCLWCNRTLHEECARHLDGTCDFGEMSRLIVPPTAVELAATRQQALQYASARYMEIMGSHLREGFQQVQEVMSSGLKEGIKEMSLGVRRFNNAIKKQFSANVVNSDYVEKVINGDTLINESSKDDSTIVDNNRIVYEDKNRYDDEHRSVSNGLLSCTTTTTTNNTTTSTSIGGKASSSSSSSSSSMWLKKCDMYKLATVMPAKANVWSLVEHPYALLSHPASTPLLIFINSKSGGQCGKGLLRSFFHDLNPIQVVDIQVEKGAKRALELFRPIRNIDRLRILVCGGDGTVGWVMNDLYDVYGENNRCNVPIGVLPLGTGNDLANTLGWGSTFDGNVSKLLYRIQSAGTTYLDIWQSTGMVKDKEIFSGAFQNYMDIGVAARIALRFHRLRESHPELFQSRLGNKFLYGEVGVREFLVNPNILLRGLRIWCDGKEVTLPEPHIEGVCAINIPSFAGGVRLWKTSAEENPKNFVGRTQGHNMKKNMTLNAFPVSFIQANNERKPDATHHRLNHLDLHSSIMDKYIHNMMMPSASKNRIKKPPTPRIIPEKPHYDRTPGAGALRGEAGLGGGRKQSLTKLIIARNKLLKSLSQRNQKKPYDNNNNNNNNNKSSNFSLRSTIIHHTDHYYDDNNNINIHKNNNNNNNNSASGSIDSDVAAREILNPSRWNTQYIDDGIIEVVAFRSLFHLAQVQVGLAQPLKVCQGSDITILVPEPMPCQLDGEPSLIPACTLKITHKCKSLVLMPARKASQPDAHALFSKILEEAVKNGVISVRQKNRLEEYYSV